MRKEQLITIAAGQITLEGTLNIGQNDQGIVVFAHGSGSSRFSPRNNFVAQILQRESLATLLFDLLTPEEDTLYENRFNIDLLTERLILVTDWIAKQKETQELNLGLYGASTGAAAALKAAAVLKDKVKAIVSRGGRPDLALNEIPQVAAPTLLIVGGLDYDVIELNQLAYGKLQTTKKLEIIPGATHLFEEPGTLEKVAEISADWFKRYLA